ncbi:MAG TPA: hypothetical protein VHN74_09875, partial [Candidatus Angelobacter sp.]|nr:hypothetical protein [Candidatus Angelobacter sp.]
TALFEQYKKVLMPNLRMGDQDTAAIIDYLARVTAARDKMMKEPGSTTAEPAGSSEKMSSQSGQAAQRH